MQSKLTTASQCPSDQTYRAVLGDIEAKGINWSAQSREQLIARIKWAVKQIDPQIIIKMFDHLPSKIRQAQEYGLDSVL